MLRHATLDDIPALLTIEQQCFGTDRLSRRSFRHVLTHGNATMVLDEDRGLVRGYVLLLFSRSTS
ncbi:MAG: ribosomal-protein-alanine acetyltransferase, partial [Candidatus Contendobacter sp.]